MLVALVLSTVLFTACSKDDDNGDETSGIHASKIVATNVVDGSDEIETVQAVTWNNDEDLEVAEGPYKNNGFVLELPASIEDKYLSLFVGAEGLPEDATISDRNVKMTSIYDFYAFNGDDEEIGYFTYASAVNDNEGHGVEWVYVNGDVNIQYSGTEEDEEYNEVYNYSLNVNLKKGWNIIYISYAKSTSGGKDIYTDIVASKKPVGVNFTWYYFGYDSANSSNHQSKVDRSSSNGKIPFLSKGNIGIRK